MSVALVAKFVIICYVARESQHRDSGKSVGKIQIKSGHRGDSPPGSKTFLLLSKIPGFSLHSASLLTLTSLLCLHVMIMAVSPKPD